MTETPRSGETLPAPLQPTVADAATAASPAASRVWKTRFTCAAQLGIALATAGLLAGPFGRWSYICDLASNFRVQYALLLLLSGLILAAVRTRLGWVAAILGAALVMATGGLSPQATVRPPETLRIVSFNVLYANQKHAKVSQFIRRLQPDLVVLIEVTPTWLRAVEPTLSEFPYRIHDARNPDVGMAIYSRLPILEPQPIQNAEAYSCELEKDPRTRFRLIALHATSPVTRRHWLARNQMLTTVAAVAAQAPNRPRTLLIGDFNCTPWSVWFHRLVHDSGLQDSAAGGGLQPTWYALPTRLAAIPIDHALAGQEIQIVRREVGPALGSDHRPIIVDIRLRTAEPPESKGP